MPPATAPTPTAPPKGKTVEPAKVEPKTEAPVKKRKAFRFKLLKGMHVQGEPVIKDDGKGNKIEVMEDKIYQADPKKGVFPVIDTDVDLSMFNGEHAHMQKYEKLIGSAVETIQDPTRRLAGETVNQYLKRMEELTRVALAKREELLKNLDTLTQDQLVALGQQEEIDLSGCKSLEEVRATLREGLVS